MLLVICKYPMQYFKSPHENLWTYFHNIIVIYSLLNICWLLVIINLLYSLCPLYITFRDYRTEKINNNNSAWEADSSINFDDMNELGCKVLAVNKSESLQEKRKRACPVDNVEVRKNIYLQVVMLVTIKTKMSICFQVNTSWALPIIHFSLLSVTMLNGIN